MVPPILWVVFLPHNACPLMCRRFNFDEVQFIYLFFFCSSSFWGRNEAPAADSTVMKVPLFYSKSVLVLVLIFRSLICFEFSFAHGVESGSSCVVFGYPLVSATLV